MAREDCLLPQHVSLTVVACHVWLEASLAVTVVLKEGDTPKDPKARRAAGLAKLHARARSFDANSRV